MGNQIIKQPDGLYAVWSTIVDAFVLIDCTRDDIVAAWSAEAREETERNVDRFVTALDKGEKPYYQFTMTFNKAMRKYRAIHGGRGLSVESLRRETRATAADWPYARNGTQPTANDTLLRLAEAEALIARLRGALLHVREYHERLALDKEAERFLNGE